MRHALLAITELDASSCANAKIMGNVVPLQGNANVPLVGKEMTAVSHAPMVPSVSSAKRTAAA